MMAQRFFPDFGPVFSGDDTMERQMMRLFFQSWINFWGTAGFGL